MRDIRPAFRQNRVLGTGYGDAGGFLDDGVAAAAIIATPGPPGSGSAARLTDEIGGVLAMPCLRWND